MAATVIIKRLTGAKVSHSATTLDTITGLNTRANAVDTHTTADTASPIKIPTTAITKYSYWVTTRLEVTAAPAVEVSNLRWFTDGGNSLGTGVDMYVATSIGNSYVQATGTPADTGTLLSTVAHGGLTLNATVAFNYTSGAPFAVVGSIGAATSNTFGSLVIYQTLVYSNAGPGPTGVETLTWRYDEI